MKTTLGKKAGFCWGVRRAMNMVLDLADETSGRVYTYGPLIHNPQVIEMLRQRGIEDFAEKEPPGDLCSSDIVLTRAHGVTPDVLQTLQKQGVSVADGTCPKVKAVQKIIEKNAKQGRHAVIIGDKGHAEVLGLMGYAGSGSTVISDASEVEKLAPDTPAIVVAQTTMNQQRFAKITELIKQRVHDVVVKDTICTATESRQAEIREIAAGADCVVIVGGKHSGNTRRLAEIAGEICPRVHHIETADELSLEMFEGVERLGISAGASTPNWIIVSVLEKITYFTRRKHSPGFRLFLSLIEFLTLSNLFIAAGACVTSYVVQRCLGYTFRYTFSLISFLYIYSMITLHKYTDRKSFALSEPLRLSFYDRYSAPFKLLSIASLVASLLGSYFLSWEVFVFLFVCYFGGLIYDRKFIPRPLVRMLRFASLRDIPASKTVSLALGFASVTVLLPLLHYRQKYDFNVSHFYVFFYFLWLIFTRQAFFDIRDMQGDRMVSKETLPTVIGPRATRLFVYSGTLIMGGFTVALGLSGNLPVSIWVFLVPLGYNIFYYRFFTNTRNHYGLVAEFWIDMVFFLTAGVMLLSETWGL